MASPVKGDHHSPPFHGWAYINCLRGCVRLCFIVWRNNTVSLPLTVNCLSLSSRPRRLQAGERGDFVQNWGEAAGGEGRAHESRGRRSLCHQETGTWVLCFASFRSYTTIMCLRLEKLLLYPSYTFIPQFSRWSQPLSGGVVRSRSWEVNSILMIWDAPRSCNEVSPQW